MRFSESKGHTKIWHRKPQCKPYLQTHSQFFPSQHPSFHDNITDHHFWLSSFCRHEEWLDKTGFHTPLCVVECVDGQMGHFSSLSCAATQIYVWIWRAGFFTLRLLMSTRVWFRSISQWHSIYPCILCKPSWHMTVKFKHGLVQPARTVEMCHPQGEWVALTHSGFLSRLIAHAANIGLWGRVYYRYHSTRSAP